MDVSARLRRAEPAGSVIESQGVADKNTECLPVLVTVHARSKPRGMIRGQG